MSSLCRAVRNPYVINRFGENLQQIPDLTDLCPEHQVPVDLFSGFDLPETQRAKTLMATLDEINAKMGRGTVRSAGEGIQKPWAMRSGNKSNAFTTDWEQLAVVS